MVLIVHYNTIVHPFTLADNRHYIFYVFRLLLRYRITKYLAIPVYFLCSYAVFGALAGSNTDLQVDIKKREDTDRPVPKDQFDKSSAEHGPRASWLLIWLMTIALSLSTAPLVEPRYSILPWMIWRMHIPMTRHSLTQRRSKSPIDTSLRSGNSKRAIQLTNARKSTLNHGLWLETAWFVIVNAVTGYMFLYRGFTWPQEPGKVQRFMW